MEFEQSEKLSNQSDFTCETQGNKKTTNTLVVKLNQIEENHQRMIVNKDSSVYKITNE